MSCVAPKPSPESQLRQKIENHRLYPDEAIISSKVLELSKMERQYQIRSLFQNTYRTGFGFSTYLKFQDTLFITTAKPIRGVTPGKVITCVLQQDLIVNSDKANFILKEILQVK